MRFTVVMIPVLLLQAVLMVSMHGQFSCTVEWEMLAVENFDESTNKAVSDKILVNRYITLKNDESAKLLKLISSYPELVQISIIQINFSKIDTY